MDQGFGSCIYRGSTLPLKGLILDDILDGVLLLAVKVTRIILQLSYYFLVIHNSTDRPPDCATLIVNRYGAADSTIFFIEGPAV